MLHSPSELQQTIQQWPARTQIVVIGAGMMGLSTAWWLGKQGQDVVVIDRRLPASGASGRNAGIMTAGTELGYHRLAQHHGEFVARDVTTHTRESQQFIVRFLETHAPQALSAPGFIRLWITEQDREDALGEATGLSALGLDVQLLEVERVQRLLGTTTGKRVLGGSWFAFNIALDPGAYLGQLLAQAAHAGVRVRVPVSG